MDIDIEGKKRNILPRLRDFRTTLSLGELAPLASLHSNRRLPDGTLEEQISAWEQNHSLSFATDLVGASLVSGIREGIKDAVDFILSEGSNSTDLQRRIALQALDPEFSPQFKIEDNLPEASSDEVIDQSRQRVRRLRELLKDGLRNPIRLVDISREYAVLGSLEKAKRAMITAVAQAPANRFVLRSAVRLFVHLREIDRAHHILKNAPSLRTDPWLLAAEISVSSMMDRTSGHIRTGMLQIKDENHSAFEISELASAIATLEMNNANSKLARKLFRKALRKPTENSIAQAVWASRSMQNLSIEVQNFNAPRKFEALAWTHYEQKEWNSALNQGKGWILDQPFAATPVLFSGHVASIIEDFGLGEKIYRFGLRANPDNRVLLNNLAFVLASNNEPDVAEIELNKIDKSSLSIEEEIVVTATEGLIKFRKGLIQEGRALYKEAIKKANEHKQSHLVLRAFVFYAREEVNARTESAKQVLLNAESEAEHIPVPEDLDILLKKLQALVESDPLAASVVRRAGEDIKRIKS